MVQDTPVEEIPILKVVNKNVFEMGRIFLGRSGFIGLLKIVFDLAKVLRKCLLIYRLAEFCSALKNSAGADFSSCLKRI